MPQFGLLLLVHVFSALLPPVDPEEDSFYCILDVEKNATPEEIRKAYKKLSLRLHPDKVAQRGDLNAEKAAAEYEKVQEAYGVLANEQKREAYDALRTPTRYRFFAQGALANPGALYENLTGASFLDKTRLLAFVLCKSCFGLGGL
jgi:DnaJ-class molecular chaperone